MPQDVLQGYIFFDSLMKINLHQWEVDSIINRIGDSDTLRYALRYAYEMIDFDPIRFYQFQNLFPNVADYKRRAPYGILSAILERAGTVIPDSGKKLAAIVGVDAILHIHVWDTSSIIDSTKQPGLNRSADVKANIVETIKGQVLPGCTDSCNTGADHRAKAPGTCIEFQYWSHWLRFAKGTALMPIVPGKEYIILLGIIGLGRDSSSAYITISPNGMGMSSTLGIYEIEGGSVLDPHDDFGYGTSVPVADFKQSLRATIQSIVSYQ